MTNFQKKVENKTIDELMTDIEKINKYKSYNFCSENHYNRKMSEKSIMESELRCRMKELSKYL